MENLNKFILFLLLVAVTMLICVLMKSTQLNKELTLCQSEVDTLSRNNIELKGENLKLIKQNTSLNQKWQDCKTQVRQLTETNLALQDTSKFHSQLYQSRPICIKPLVCMKLITEVVDIFIALSATACAAQFVRLVCSGEY